MREGERGGLGPRGELNDAVMLPQACKYCLILLRSRGAFDELIAISSEARRRRGVGARF